MITYVIGFIVVYVAFDNFNKKQKNLRVQTHWWETWLMALVWPVTLGVILSDFLDFIDNQSDK